MSVKRKNAKKKKEKKERRKCVTACVQYGRMGPKSMALDRSEPKIVWAQKFGT